jgi:hypothetical protein
MADFCAQCSAPYPSDFAGIPWDPSRRPLEPGEGYAVLCEGCGPTLVDTEGNCLGGCMGDHHTGQAHFHVPIERQLPVRGTTS